jgi:hypothetical protein
VAQLARPEDVLSSSRIEIATRRTYGESNMPTSFIARA